MKRITKLLLISGALFSIIESRTPLVAQEFSSIEEFTVSTIDILPQNLAPNATFNTAAVLTCLQTKTGRAFSQYEFDQDLKKLALEYDKIEPSVEIVNCEARISLRIWLKPLIHSITFIGNDRLSASKLMKELDLETAVLFERDEFLNKLNKVKQLYLKKGFFEADLCYELQSIDNGSQIDIVINIDEGKAGRISCIEYAGMTPGEEDEIREFVMSRRYYTLVSWFTGTGCYHPEVVERDRLMILDYYQNRGYADAAVSIYLDDISCPGKAVLIISVEKGAYYTIGNICFEGNTLFDGDAVENCFTIFEGKVFSPEDIRATAQGIRTLYGKSGYIESNISTQLHLRPEACVYDVTFAIEEGEPYCVGMIRVFGNRCTHTKVLLNESLLCPGEVFDIRKLEGTEARLLNTGLYSAVNVYAVATPTEDTCYRDVYIEVEETDTGNIGLFLGANSLDTIFGGVDITERNFNLLGFLDVLEKGPIAFRGRGEYLHSKINIGKRQTNYILQWAQPYFLDTPWCVGIDLEKSYNRLLSKGYELKTYGGNAHGTYIWNHFLRYSVHYRGIHSRTKVRDDNNEFLEEEGKISGFISAVGAAAIYDSTDCPRRPCGGLRSKFSTEIAGVGGNFDFVKLSYCNSYYYPLLKRGTLKFRADFQYIFTYGHTHPTGLPLSERLFLGGETTVRGYKNFIIGPKFANNEPRGGVSSYLLSEEYQYNILKAPCVDAFVFVDAGYVSLSQGAFGRPAASVGFGLRMEIMKNVPLMLGLGYPIHPIEEFINPNGTITRINNAQRFFFSMGGCF